MMPSLRSLSLLLQLLSSWTCVLGTSSPLTAAGVDKKIDEDFYPIVNGLPPGFVFGTASAAYQIEGAVKEGGRGATIWDTFSHMDPPKVARNENGDVACDSYHRYEEDADLAKAAGFDGFRLSFAWSRIYPEGEGEEPNAEGVQHYHDVIDALLERGLEPMVTLYHWDLPQALEDKHGGWLNASIVPAFESYADTCFREYGGKVKKWLTLNEPWSFIHHGYSSGMHAPGRCSDRKVCDEGDSFTEPYLAGHNALNAHARAVSLYRTRYKVKQGGMIGITLNCDWGAPLDPDSDEDKEAASRAVDFQLGWFADPIYFGEYPGSMRDRVGVRLPKFTEEEGALIAGSNDFFGLNHYTSWYYTDIPDTDPPRNGTSAAAAKAAGIDLPKTPPNDGWAQDIGAIQTKLDLEGNPNGFATESPWLTAVPGGFRVLLKYVAERYGNPVIMVTENGMDREGEAGMAVEEALRDRARQEFYDGYLRSMVAAIVEDGVDVRSYYAWSILDNFEWSDGYAPRFGLTYVDYDADQTRTAKDSSKWFARLADARDAHAHWRATADGILPADEDGEGDGENGDGNGVEEGVHQGQGGEKGGEGEPTGERERGGKGRGGRFWVELSLVVAAVIAVGAAVVVGKLGGRWGRGTGEPREQTRRRKQRYEGVQG